MHKKYRLLFYVIFVNILLNNSKRIILFFLIFFFFFFYIYTFKHIFFYILNCFNFDEEKFNRIKN